MDGWVLVRVLAAFACSPFREYTDIESGSREHRVDVFWQVQDAAIAVDRSCVLYPDLLLMPQKCKAPDLLEIWRRHLEQAGRCGTSS